MGRYWATGPQDEARQHEQNIKDMQKWGATPAQIERYRKKISASHCWVLEQNWDALLWFQSVSDCIAVHPMTGTLLGLDIQAVKADAEMSGREIIPDDYKKLRIIARSAVIEYNKRDR